MEDDVPQRVALAVFGIPQRREFPGEQTVRFLLRQYSKYAEHLWKPVLCCSGGILFMQSTMWVLISCCYVWRIFLSVMLDRRPSTAKILHWLNKSAKVPLRLLSVFYFPQSKIEYCQSKNCSAGNPPLFVNPRLKSTWMDAILREFEFKMNFKLKINLKRDRTNFRST
jgi:hypothetical protein